MCLTPAGQALLDELHQDLDHHSTEVLNQLSAEEQQQLHQGLMLYLRGLRHHHQQQGFTIRPLQIEDEAAIAQVIRDVSAEHGLTAAKGYGVADPELDHLFPLYQGAGRAYWVITDPQGKILGGGGIAPLQGAKESVCELQKMYFLPQLRGKGLGRRLVQQALAFARNAGYRSCYLETTAVLNRATHLYQQLGFRHLESPLGNTGHCSCEIHMSLDLDSTCQSVPVSQSCEPTGNEPCSCSR